jgi:2,3-bisphosphoglycerate-dependent phosphoglycerate mutase
MEKRQGTHLILVRHGETEANVRQVWHGALDAPLTDRGRLQVEATAHHLAARQRTDPLAAFYVSPLARAQSTAAAIAVATGLPPVIEAGLREFTIGDWEGRSFADLHATENLWGRWQEDPEFTPPNGESLLAFNRRVVTVLKGLVDAHPGAAVLAVTHGGFIASALSTFLGRGPRDWQRYDPPNCAVSELVWDGAAWTGLTVNDVAHIPSASRPEAPPWAV